MVSIKHYPTCNPNYPEKEQGEKAQQTIRIPLDDNQVVVQCVDCGAFGIEHKDNDETT